VRVVFLPAMACRSAAAGVLILHQPLKNRVARAKWFTSTFVRVFVPPDNQRMRTFASRKVLVSVS